MHKLCHMETFDYAMCHNIRPFKIIIITKNFWFLFCFENAQIMPHKKIDLATCINIKASIMVMEIKKFIFHFHFLKMHKLCHVAMCNWLLGKLHLVVTNFKNLYNQSIWFYKCIFQPKFLITYNFISISCL
jgi:hypothetical protein